MRLRAVSASIVASSLLAASSGCLASRFMGRTAGAWAEPTRAVANKLSNPVRSDAGLAVTWVGHATVLVQLDDRFVLTDPVFTNTVGQISPRLVEPGLEPRSLPAIDAVVISHLHFDHLSLGSIELIERKVRWLGLPQGGLAYLTDFDFAATEVPAWTTVELSGMKVTSVPVEHGGWRYGLDRSWMPRGATGWVIEYHGMTVYFGGDTAYVRENFAAARKRFPRIDVALLPIAPVEPREFMRSRHMSPDEALRAYEELGARWLVPIHFDTFVNSLDEPGAATAALRRGMGARGLSSDEVVVLGIGEQRLLRNKE